MKKILLISTISFILFACTKENGTNPPGETNITFTDGSWTQYDTARYVVGTFPVEEIDWNFSINNTTDSAIVTGFVRISARIALKKSTKNETFSFLQVANVAPYEVVSNLKINRISSTKFSYEFNENWYGGNEKKHTGTCMKN